MAQALMSLLIGWVVQAVLLADVDPPENYLNGVETLLTGLRTPS